MNIKKAVGFCEKFNDNHKSSCHIDYLISGDSIKPFFIINQMSQNSMVILLGN